MLKLRKCSHCGEIVYDTVDHNNCMYCGEALKAVNRVEVEYYEEYSPNSKQKVAAFLFALSVFIPWLANLSFVQQIIIDTYMNATAGDTSNSSIILLLSFPYIISNVFFLMGTAILCFCANNKATRISTYILLGTMVMFTIYDLLMYAGPQQSQVFFWLFEFIPTLAMVYAFGLVSTNNFLSYNNRIWVNLLPVVYCCFTFMLIFSNIPAINGLNDQSIYFMLTQTIMYYILCSALAILKIVAIWKFARCEAFSAKYNPMSVDDYMPFNKYMASILIAPSVVMLCMYLFFKYGAQFILF